MAIIWGKSIKEFVGKVVSDKMKKTLVVAVSRVKMHPIYKKRFVVSKKYYVHAEDAVAKAWDTVKIQECRPLSRLKRRILVEIL